MKLITRVAILAAALVLPALASAATYVSVTVAPPPLPVYAQPICPGDGYIWTPGYWAWDGADYYWVPGTWVLAPAVDVFWTPGYWGWGGGYYAWHGGYWGPHVGFYGGVNYGYGYGGVGYEGGRWQGGRFHYNTAVNNINVVTIHNTYRTTIVNNNGGNRVSFNGGDGGIRSQPTSRELAAAHDNHIGWTSVQQQHERAASSDSSMRFSQNRGNPAIAATQRPSASSDHESPRNGNDAHPAQGHMNSSNFAPHADSRSGNDAVPIHDHAQAPHDKAPSVQRGSMPSSGYAPHDRPQRSDANAPHVDHVEAQHVPSAPNPNQMNRPQMNQQHGGEHHPPAEHHQGGGAPRPQPEHHREER